MFTSKFRYWLAILLKFVSVQLMVQALGFTSSILIVRSLTKNEYAYFLIANTIESTIDLMSDIGITIALNSIGGQIWQDKAKFSQLIITAFFIRRYLIFFAAIIISPILCLLLYNAGASFSTIFFLMVAILIELYFYSIIKVLAVIPRLHSEFNQIQKLDFVTSLTRLVGLVVIYSFGLNAITAAFCSTISSGINSFFLYRWTKSRIDYNTQVNLDYKHQIWSLIKSQLLPTTFHCLQGQISIWLVSIFGNTKSIADIGALSRLGTIFTVINPVINSIVVPKYARYRSLKLLRNRYWQLLTVFVAIASCIMAIFAIFSAKILLILGEQYSNLSNEMILVILSTLITSLASIVWSLNYARAWVDQSWLTIPFTVLAQVILLFTLDISTLQGVILFGLFSAIPFLLVNLYMSNLGMRSLNHS
jgi:O-antigen/teichoic acid export membrane protein